MLKSDYLKMTRETKMTCCIRKRSLKRGEQLWGHKELPLRREIIPKIKKTKLLERVQLVSSNTARNSRRRVEATQPVALNRKGKTVSSMCGKPEKKAHHAPTKTRGIRLKRHEQG